MKNIAVSLVAALLLVLQACEPAPPRTSPPPSSSSPMQSENIAAVIADIESMGNRLSSGEIAAARTLPHNINVLTRAINSGSSDTQGMVMLRYYCGVARQMLSGLNRVLGLPADRQMAEAALTDFEFVANAKDPESAELAKNALYLAGQGAAGELGDQARSMRYFQRCSDMKHAGCQGVIASAKITGTAGFARDIPGAVRLHQEAFATGLDYGCSGSFAAYSLARLTQFAGVKAEDRSSLEWMRRAVRLADQMKVRASGIDYCAGNFMTVYEYLIRLEAGERDNALLEPLDSQETQGGYAAVVVGMLGYIRDGTGESAYRKSVEDLRDADARCQFAFIGLWKAAISKQTATARAYREMLQQSSDEPSCGENLVFAGKYLR